MDIRNVQQTDRLRTRLQYGNRVLSDPEVERIPCSSCSENGTTDNRGARRVGGKALESMRHYLTFHASLFILRKLSRRRYGQKLGHPSGSP